MADALGKWLTWQRHQILGSLPSARATDDGFKRAGASRRYQCDGDMPADSNPVENDMRPIAIGRNN